MSTMIYPSGIIAYADQPIVFVPPGSGGPNYYTSGLLSIFTEVTNATPTVGSKMRPFLINPLVKSEPCYRVNSGSTAGTYSINRNHPVGETFYNNWDGTAQFSLQDFYNYKHWPDDQRLAIDLRMLSPNTFYFFSIKCGVAPIMDLSAYSGGSYNSPLDYYGVFPNSAGNFSPNTVNTGWNLDISFGYDSSMNFSPPYTQDWDILCTDYHTGDTMYQNPHPFTVGDPVLGPPGTVPVQFIQIYIDYWRCPNLQISVQ